MLPLSSDLKAEQETESAPPPPGDDQRQMAGLSGEQQAWLSQMSAQYGPSFDRDKWIQSMLEQNREAAMRQHQVTMVPVPAPRPPSPQIPPMPPFPVAPTSSDPAEYAKYKRDYDAYTDWYNKYAVMYAAKQDKKTQALPPVAP